MSTKSINYWEEINRWLSLRRKYTYTLEIAAHNISGINFMSTRGPAKRLDDDLKEGRDYFDSLIEVLDHMKRSDEYKASVVPTMVSWNKGRGLWIKNVEPSSIEKGYFAYMVTTGLGYRPHREAIVIVNFIGDMDLESKAKLWQYIFRREDIGSPLRPNWKVISSGSFDYDIPLNVEGKPLSYVFATAILIQYAKFLGQTQALDPDADLSMVVLTVGRSIPNELQVFTRINRLVGHWFDDVINNKGRGSSGFGRFVGSLYISDMKYRDKSVSMLNKFLHSFLNGQVSGELLDKLINLRVTYMLGEVIKSKGRAYGFRGAQFFFSKL